MPDAGSFDGEPCVSTIKSPWTTSSHINQYFDLAKPTPYPLISIISYFPTFLCQSGCALKVGMSISQICHQVPGTPRRGVHFAVSPPGHRL